MLITHQYPFNKSLMVGVVGVPNVGKSSLINHLLGFDLSIVTNKPQTTRNFFHCALTIDHTEIIFIDTPGLHRSAKEINLRMNQQAVDGSEETDLNLFLIDINKDWEKQFKEVNDLFKSQWNKTWIVFTKSDLVKEEISGTVYPLAENFFERTKREHPHLDRYFMISVTSEDNIHQLVGALCDVAQPGPHLYPKGDVSNKNERFFVTEYIREQAFKILQDELPYEIAVIIDEFRDLNPEDAHALNKDEEGEEGNHQDHQSQSQNQRPHKRKIVSYISASILVNRPSQRAIVVGSKGSVIKEIGTKAREKIEALLGGPVHLNLHVKTSPKWDKNNYILEELGLPRAPSSKRVWRKKF